MDNATVLVPVLSRLEADAAFLESVCADASKVLFVTVIDSQDVLGSLGFAAGQLRQATELMERASVWLTARQMSVDTVLEWGDVVSKTAHLAELNNCKRIILVRQSNQYYTALVSRLKTETTIPIVEIPVAVPKTR